MIKTSPYLNLTTIMLTPPAKRGYDNDEASSPSLLAEREPEDEVSIAF
jgi:hypothetical protein